MPVNAIKSGGGSGLAAFDSFCFRYARSRYARSWDAEFRHPISRHPGSQPFAGPSATRRNRAIDPSTTILSRGGTLPLILLLAACGGGGGGGGGDGPVTTAPQPPVPAPAKTESVPPEPADPEPETAQPDPAPPEPDPTPKAEVVPVRLTTRKEVPPPSEPRNAPPADEPRPDPGGSRESSVGVSGSLYDPPIIGARVYVDVNRNRIVDKEDYLLDDSTDASGGFNGTVPIRYVHLPLIADNRGASHDGVENDKKLPYFFVAPPGSKAISPVTHIIELSVVSKTEIENHVLFAEFRPFDDNPYDTRKTHIFSNRIEEFLPELTQAIFDTTEVTRNKAGEVTEVTTDTQALRLRVEKLLEKYEARLSDLDKSVPADGYLRSARSPAGGRPDRDREYDGTGRNDAAGGVQGEGCRGRSESCRISSEGRGSA